MNINFIKTFLFLSFFGNLSAQNFCDPLDLVRYFHNITTDDAANPQLTIEDTQCIQNYVVGNTLVAPCRTSDPRNSTNVYAHMDVTNDGATDNTIMNVTTFDAQQLWSYIQQPDDASKLAFFHSNMPAAKAEWEQRACNRAIAASCSSDYFAEQVLDYDSDGDIDVDDITCLQGAGLYGGGTPFSNNHPDCAPTNDPIRSYNLLNSAGFRYKNSTSAVTYLQGYVNRTISSYDIPFIQRMTDHHGCTASPITPPDAALAITLIPTTTTYNINVGDNVRIPMVPSGGSPSGNYTASYGSNPINVINMSIDINDATYQYVFDFTPTTPGTWTVDLSVGDGISLATEQVTFNVSNPAPTGTAPVFDFPNPWEGWQVFAYAQPGAGFAGYSVTGEDADGGETVTLSSDGMAPGDYVSQEAFDPSRPNDFSGAMRFQRNASQVGTYSFKVIASDTGGRTSERNLTYTLYSWFENITNPLAGNAPVSLNSFTAGSEMGEDVPFTLSLGDTAQLEFEYPNPPPGESWSHSVVTSSI